MPLNDVKVRKAKPDYKAFRLWDSDGLYLEVSPAGAKLCRFKYRFNGKEKLLALGKWNLVSLAEARQGRDDAKRLLARGMDPNAQREAQKRDARDRTANSFEVVAREWYGKHWTQAPRTRSTWAAILPPWPKCSTTTPFPVSTTSPPSRPGRRTCFAKR